MLLAAMFGTEIRFCPERGKWLHWTGQIWEWQPRGGGYVRELAKDAIRSMDTPDNETRQHRRKSLNNTSISNMLGAAETHTELVVALEELDAQPWELNTPGGIIDLRTGQLGQSRPEQLHTRMTKHTPDFEADRSMWLRFLDQTFAGNAELIAYMQRLIGYTVVGEVREHVLPFCYGTGGNGKGVFLETIARLIGRYASTAPNDFLMASAGNKHETEIAELAGKRMVLASEVKEESKFDEAKANRLTGGDTLTGRFMRQDYFDFEPTHTLWIMGNHQPDVQAGGNNFWRRMRLIPFTQEVAKEDIIPDLQNILAREHGPAILAWIAEGAADYHRNGLQDPDIVRTATKAYAQAVDTVGRFLEERCITGPTAESAQMSVPVTRLRAAYESWCHENGEKAVQGRAFPSQLKRFGILTGRDMPNKGTGGARLYGNVGLQASEDEQTQDRYKDN